MDDPRHRPPAAPVCPVSRPALLQLRGVGWAARSGGPTLADISFTVPAGQVLGLAGPPGAGRSVLLRLLCRALPPTRGSVLLHGRDLWLIPPQEAARSVAAVLQAPVDPGLTLRQLVALGRQACRASGRPGWRDAEAVAEVLERLNLAPLARRRFGTLRPGDRQLARLACALAQDPALVVLDRPADPDEARHLPALLHHLRRLGLAAVCALPEPGPVPDAVDRVIRLQHGRLLADGPAALSPASLATARGR